MRKTLLWTALLIASVAPLASAAAQSATAPASPPAASQAPAAALTDAELDQLAAPVALYPDPLLADVLMASTYPLEIVEAARWADANKSMSDVDRAAALDQQAWHASVKSLVATPTVLAMMNAQLAWTQKLGAAVLADEQGVLAAVQRLRAQAQAAQTLKSTDQQTVTVQTQESSRVIIIEPAVAGVVYVPYYDPFVVYRPWRWPTWPPFYFPPPAGYIAFGSIDVGFAFGIGFRFNAVVAGGFDWWHGDINIRWHINIDGNADVHVESWHHDLNDRTADFPPPDRDDGQTAARNDKAPVSPATDSKAAAGDGNAADDDDHPDRQARDHSDDDDSLDDDQDREDHRMETLGDDDAMRDDGGFRNGGGFRDRGFGWRRPYDDGRRW